MIIDTSPYLGGITPAQLAANPSITGIVSFSTFRTNFLGQTSGEVKFSRFYRGSGIGATIPNATENQRIPTVGIISMRSFLGATTEKVYTQTGIDENVSVQSYDWNNNLLLEVPKRFKINGICGSLNTALPAVTLSMGTTNFYINVGVGGSVLGAGGQGTSGATLNATSGGNAMSITNLYTGGTITVTNNGMIAGGGGGGGRGGIGGNGGTGGSGNGKYQTKSPDPCVCPACPPACGYPGSTNTTVNGRSGGGGGTGGTYGHGAPGRGYNNILGSLLGVPGTPGTGGGPGQNCPGGGDCPTDGSSGSGGPGGPGGSGGVGGDWNSDGNDGAQGAAGPPGNNGTAFATTPGDTHCCPGCYTMTGFYSYAVGGSAGTAGPAVGDPNGPGLKGSGGKSIIGWTYITYDPGSGNNLGISTTHD